ncbi:hypothetical protein Q7C36_020155 [Tachysurus vachellii]|uniref:Uncharacterized protein n=1 Tax=Tachysurus vachellii TaxID=175792 RepID=A0AA88LT46_TACVA|nr:hypothetical protein Q7C36_020155 [Tachysurus vachellii]
MQKSAAGPQHALRFSGSVESLSLSWSFSVLEEALVGKRAPENSKICAGISCASVGDSLLCALTEKAARDRPCWLLQAV